MVQTATPAVPVSAAPPHKPWYKVLYIQVLIAIALGILVGRFYPAMGAALKPLGDGFIQLIKMMIAPVIFCTVVQGIASMGDLKSVGCVGLKALIYFEAVSTLALAIGLLVGRTVQPGAGFDIDPASLDPKQVAGSCLVPGFDGALFSLEWKDALWAKFCMGAPARRRQCVARSSIVKRA